MLFTMFIVRTPKLPSSDMAIVNYILPGQRWHRLLYDNIHMVAAVKHYPLDFFFGLKTLSMHYNLPTWYISGGIDVRN